MDKKTLFDILREDEEIQAYKTIIRNAGEIPPPLTIFEQSIEEYREELKEISKKHMKV